MKAQPLPDEGDEVEHAADARGLAALDAGRVISGEAVLRWVRSWGRSDELAKPQVGD